MKRIRMVREEMTFDAIVVGAGPAGLAAAIRFGQLAQEEGRPVSLCLLEKGVQVGAHLLSGAAMDPVGLDRLLPQWRHSAPFSRVEVGQERLLFLSSRGCYPLPHFDLFGHKGALLVSLAQVCVWLATQAQELGIHIFPGTVAQRLDLDDQGSVCGIITGDRGRDKEGNPKRNFQPGLRLKAKHVLLAEGARGFLSGQAIRHFGLARNAMPQRYALGLKEVWQMSSTSLEPGTAIHTLGWPLGGGVGGGGFLYCVAPNRLALGLVVDLGYANPHVDPFALFQHFKTHPWLRGILQGGQAVEFGARVLAKGGVQSLPEISFPGGVLVGDAAGFLDGMRLKGIHTAILSGMSAAETLYPQCQGETIPWKRLQQEVLPTLERVRNVVPALEVGLLPGLVHGYMDQKILRGRAPWTWKRRREDRSALRPAHAFHPSPPPSGLEVRDRDQALSLAGVRHREDQPNHLLLHRDSEALQRHHRRYALPEKNYCPGGVFVAMDREDGIEMEIRAHRCLHCKTCDIKDPEDSIRWTPPEGGSGPRYRSL